MPKNKDLKRLTRRRMQKTGESYTAARAQLVSKSKAKAPLSSPTGAAREYAAIAGMSDTAVRAKTGRTWKEWVAVLDAVEATQMSHRDIAQHLHAEHSIPGWWSQTVTVGYERIRGLRDIGQRRDGGYEANKSKTFPVAVEALFAAFSEARQRQRWLPEAGIRVRKATPHKSVRITWSDGTSVEAYLVAKGAAKSQVAIQHRKLARRADAEAMKKYWDKRLGVLATVLASTKRIQH